MVNFGVKFKEVFIEDKLRIAILTTFSAGIIFLSRLSKVLLSAAKPAS